jgi:non-specific serine/threonine protein kinase
MSQHPPHQRITRETLPRYTTSFVGRDLELAALARLCAANRLVTICGTGGAGKTRLAVEMCHRATDLRGFVAFVDLAPVTESRALWPQIADALALRRTDDVPIDQVVIDGLRERRVLLVLDNCEHLVSGVANVVHQILASGAAPRILATSREALGVAGETIFWLPPLPVLPGDAAARRLAPAVELFLERADSRNPGLGRTPEAVAAAARLCAQLEGLPLAIELAAGWSAAFSFNDLAALALASPGSIRTMERTAAQRHRSVADTIEWSSKLLPPQELLLFRSLAVFAGSATLEAIEHICAAPALAREDVAAAMARLVHCSLVVSDRSGERTRYRLLEPIRQWCEETLDGAEHERLNARHAAYFADLVSDLAPGLRTGRQLEVGAEIDHHVQNLRSAMRWSFGPGGHVPDGAAIAAALAWFWLMKGRSSEGMDWLRRALDRLPEEHPARPEVCIAASFLAWRTGQLSEGLELAEQARARFAAQGNKLGEARAVLWRCQHLVAMGRPGDALADLAIAELEIESSESFHDRARCDVVRMLCARAMGDLAGAYPAMVRGLALARAGGDRAQITGFLDAHAELAQATDMEAAQRFGLESLQLRRELGDVGALPNSLYMLGDCARRSGDTALAAGYVSEGLSVAHEQGDTESVGLLLMLLAALSPRRVSPIAAALASAGHEFAGRDAAIFGQQDREVVAAALAVVDSVAGYGNLRQFANVNEAVASGLELAAALSRNEVQDVPENPHRLTGREIHVLRLIASGNTNAETAGLLGVSVRTIERHISNLYGKIGARGRADATAYAIEHGFLV